MNRKATIIAGFIAFSVFELIGILSSVFMGNMSDIPLEKLLSVSLALTLCVGLFGIPLAVIFGTIVKYIPTKSLYTKSAIYFVLLNTALTGSKGISAFSSIEFLMSTVFSIIASFLFTQVYLILNEKWSAGE